MNTPEMSFITRLAEATPLIGSLVSTSSTEVAEALSLCGFEWLFIDVEHSVLDMAAAQHIIQAVSPRTYGIIRLPDNSAEHFKKALDTGCAGVIVPMIKSVFDAERAVSFAKYTPLGTRGVGLARAQAYGLKFDEYLETANTKTALILQIEHKDAIEHVEKIIAVPGVDAIFIGPYDLSASMGLLGQTGAPEVIQAIKRIRDSCRKARVPHGGFCMDAKRARDELEGGARFIALGSDLMFMTSNAKAQLQELHQYIFRGESADLRNADTLPLIRKN
jgi:2-keto-3-deoxy-L-rhamnonate aldolase RhmA